MLPYSKDEVLWYHYRNGDENAFTELSRRYYRKLLHYGLKFTSNVPLVEDALQELLIHLWQYRKTINQTEYVRFYLFKAFRHQLFKSLKKVPETAGLDAETTPAVFEVSSEERFIMQESDGLLSQRVQHMLGFLSPRQQEVIYLRFFHNLGTEEIATLLSINAQSVSNIIQRAFHKVREIWPENPISSI